MANVTPLKLALNKIKQFLSTDTVPTNNLGTGTANSTTFLRGDQTWASPTVTINETEIDFGTALNQTEASFVITDGAIISSNKILVSASYAAPTGKDQDEIEMDDLNLKAVAGTGNFTLFVTSQTGALYGKFKINYLIG